MKNLNKFMVSGLIVFSSFGFVACNDDNRVGRDAGVPNNIEDNYTGDADNNRTGAIEESVKRGASEVGNKMSTAVENTKDAMRTTADKTTTAVSNAVNGAGYVVSDRMYSASEYNSLKNRMDKLEKEVMALKSKKAGPDIVGQK